MYLMYLRKSRADNPSESVEEVLQKHYTILQDFCEREFSARIPECDIYREVVSGESIEDRVEIKKVLNRCEDPAVEGVIVVEPQRLSRGDLVDCGTLIDRLRFSHTVVVTPTATYDLNNKMERRFFQDELLRGRDYLEYTKEILRRGRVLAVKRGCFIQSTPPYGYDKVRIGKDYTLAPNSDAEIVQWIFKRYIEGDSPHAIATELKRQGIPSPSGRADWKKETITKILKNQHYIGRVTFGHRAGYVKIIEGEKVEGRKYQDDYVVAEGKHPAIISVEDFERVQARFASHPPVKADREQRNIFAGMLFCARCGAPLQYKNSPGRITDKTYGCQTAHCSKTIPCAELDALVIEALKHAELPALKAKWKNGDGSSLALQKKRIKSLEKELSGLHAQEETQYEMLENRTYTPEVFSHRNKLLRGKIDRVSAQLSEAQRELPDAIDYQERVATLEEAISALPDPEISVRQKNLLLGAIIERIEVTSNKTEKKYDRDISLKIKLKL